MSLWSTDHQSNITWFMVVPAQPTAIPVLSLSRDCAQLGCRPRQHLSSRIVHIPALASCPPFQARALNISMMPKYEFCKTAIVAYSLPRSSLRDQSNGTLLNPSFSLFFLASCAAATVLGTLIPQQSPQASSLCTCPVPSSPSLNSPPSFS